MALSVERRVLIDAFATLQKSICPVIDELTSELYSAKLVCTATRDNNQGTGMEKAKRVLSAVERSVDVNRKNYYIFEETLKQFHTLDYVVSCLVKRRDELEKNALPAPHQVADTNDGSINSRSQCIAPQYAGQGLSHQVHNHFYLATTPPSSDQRSLVSAMSKLQLQQKGEPAEEMTRSAVTPPLEVCHGVTRNATAVVRLLAPTPTDTTPLAGEDNILAPFHQNMGEGEALKEKAGVTRKGSVCGQMKPIQEEKPPCPSSPSRLDVPSSVRDVTDSLHSVCSSSSSYSSQASAEDDEWEELVQMQEKAWKLYKQTKKKNKTLSRKLKRMSKHLKCTQEKERKLRENLEQLQAREDEEKLTVKKELELTQCELEDKTEQHSKLLEEVANKEAEIQTLTYQLELTKKECEKLKVSVQKFMEKALGERKLMLSYKQKYEQLKDEIDSDYYELYCEAKKESDHLHHQLMACQMKNMELEQQIDFLLETSVTNCQEGGCSQDTLVTDLPA